MTSSAETNVKQFLVTFNDDAVLDVVRRVRSAHEEVDPLSFEVVDDAPAYDRRKARRVQLRMPLILQPVEDSSGQSDIVEAFGGEQLALTRDLANQGLGILHDEPIVTEYAVLQFDIPGERPCPLYYEIRWTVRKSQFSYMSGGRLIGIVEPVSTNAD